MARLEVEIGANIKGLEKALTQAEIDLIKFGRGVDGAGKPLKNFGKTLNTNAVPAMTSFSQVIQDAPFGIQGVANNITQLTAQMGHLSKNAGGTGAALKLMLRTLAGPAGILLAVSVVTSLMVSFGTSMFKAKSDADKLKESQDELTKSLKEYEAQLIAVDKAELEGAKNATKSLVRLNLLKAQLDDTTLSEQKRIEAFNALKKLYPKYFRDIKTETALTDGLGKSYSTVLALLEDKAAANAAEKLIIDLKQQEAVLLSQIKGYERLSNAKIKVYEQEIKSLKTQKQSLASLARIDLLEKQINKEREKGGALSDEGLKAFNELEKIQSDILDLSIRIAKVGGVAPLDFGVEKQKKAAKEKKTIYQNELRDYANYAELYDNSTKDYLNNLQVATQTYMLEREKQLKAQADADNESLQLLKKFNDAAKLLIANSIANTFAGLGEAIGDALTTGGNVLQAAGKAIIAGLGKFLSDMGGMLIKYGTLAVVKGKLDLAILAGGPVSIAAGLAAIGVGVALKAAGKAIGNLAAGGGSGNYAGVGASNGGEYSSGLPSSSFDRERENIIFTIEGTQLIGVINNTTRRDVSLGGSVGLIGT